MYKLIGADQKEYGPVNADQIRRWIDEHRLNSLSLVQAEGSTEWKPLAMFPEFAASLASGPQLTAPLPGTTPARLQGAVSAAVPHTNSMALAGFVMGLLSIVCCCGVPFGVLGIVFSLIGLSQINKDPLEQGKGLAIAGLVLSILSIPCSLAGWILQLPSYFGEHHWKL